jgi:hypothetical protein
VIGRGTPRSLQGRRRLWFVEWLTVSTLLAELRARLVSCTSVPRALLLDRISSFTFAATCSPQ